jgi:hypothetical protein
MKRNLVKSLSPWISFWVITAALLLLMGCAHTPTSKPTSEIKVPRITKEEVKSMIGNPDLIILDVRSAQNWSESVWHGNSSPTVTQRSTPLKGAGASGMRRNI